MCNTPWHIKRFSLIRSGNKPRPSNPQAPAWLQRATADRAPDTQPRKDMPRAPTPKNLSGSQPQTGRTSWLVLNIASTELCPHTCVIGSKATQERHLEILFAPKWTHQAFTQEGQIPDDKFGKPWRLGLTDGSLLCGPIGNSCFNQHLVVIGKGQSKPQHPWTAFGMRCLGEQAPSNSPEKKSKKPGGLQEEEKQPLSLSAAL